MGSAISDGENPRTRLKRFQSKDGREVMLPRADVQAEILHRRRRRDGVAPRHAEPFDRVAITRVAGDALEVVEHVVQAHLAHPVEQRARILEHHARLFALVNQLRDELAHALVAPVEHRGVVIVADARVVHHVLEIADDLRGLQVRAAGGNQRLVHVQGDGTGAVDILKINARGVGSGAGNCERCFRAANVREISNT